MKHDQIPEEDALPVAAANQVFRARVRSLPFTPRYALIVITLYMSSIVGIRIGDFASS
jgi:hypothetical protein